MNCYTKGAKGVSFLRRVYCMFVCEVVISSKPPDFLFSWFLRRVSPREVLKPELGRTVFESFLRNFDGKVFLGSRAEWTHFLVSHFQLLHTSFFMTRFLKQKISTISIVNGSRENRTRKSLKKNFSLHIYSRVAMKMFG